MSTPKVFISYRREDSQGTADHLYEKLEGHFGSGNVFYDVDSIPIGRNFVEYLDEQVSRCDVLLAVIGKRWLEAQDDDGDLRLQDENDFVRIEIISGLKRNNITVVPVLVEGAKIPKRSALPPEMEELSLLNAAQVRSGRDFRRDVDDLIKALEGIDGDDFSIENPIVEKAIRVSLRKFAGELTEADFAKVTILILDDTKITDAGLKEVAKLKQLEWLRLGDTKITDAGLKDVAKLQKLEGLSLSSTQITDAGLKEVAKLKQLEMLYLNNTKVTRAGAAELQKALPKCKILGK